MSMAYFPIILFIMELRSIIFLPEHLAQYCWYYYQGLSRWTAGSFASFDLKIDCDWVVDGANECWIIRKDSDGYFIARN